MTELSTELIPFVKLLQEVNVFKNVSTILKLNDYLPAWSYSNRILRISGTSHLQLKNMIQNVDGAAHGSRLIFVHRTVGSLKYVSFMEIG